MPPIPAIPPILPILGGLFYFWAYSEAGFLTVSSTDKTVIQASVAEHKAFCLTRAGSQTKLSNVLQIPLYVVISTPKCLPSDPYACFYLSLFKTSTESIPPLSAITLGITSSALAKALMIYYYFPLTLLLAWYLKYLEISISIAPPPGTTDEYFIALLTIIIASFKDLSAS